MNTTHVRARFAPSPTGFMHLGNVRAALMNFLFARQNGGTFIVRIEDTDPQRNVDIGAQQILADLTWLGLHYDEGPGIGGPYAPYFQSERSNIYTEYLHKLQEIHRVYPCFCSTEELEKKRLRQIACKIAPRYDRTCLQLTERERQERSAREPFIWRFQLDDSTVEVTDLARGTIRYDLKHFSDFPLTRQDGSFTFIFANFVDDLAMKITHIFRGEDHLSNTANQAALYKAFNATLPIFWHLPIICNSEGKKLSKRDFGFSLQDLQRSGFLPQAIDNYLTITGASFAQEIMDMPDLIAAIDFTHIASTGHIRYDLEKLRWINHKWIARLPALDLAEACYPFLLQTHPNSNISLKKLAELVPFIRSDIVTLNDCGPLLDFYINKPHVDLASLQILATNVMPVFSELLKELLPSRTAQEVFDTITRFSKEHNLARKELFACLRICVTGKAEGLGIKDLIAILGVDEFINRLQIML